MNGNYLATTTQTNYTYNGIITNSTEIVVKSTYTNYKACESTGTSIMVTPIGTTSPTTPNTTPSSTNINIVVNGNEPMSFDEYNTLLTAGTLIKVMNNGTDVTKQASIDQENCTATSCTIKIRYNGIEKTKTIAIK